MANRLFPLVAGIVFLQFFPAALPCSCRSAGSQSTSLDSIQTAALPPLQFPGSLNSVSQLIQDQIDALDKREEAFQFFELGASVVEVTGVPGPSALLSTLDKIFAFVKSTEELQRQLTSLKIDEAFIRHSIVTLRSKFSPLRNRMQKFMNRTLLLADRKAEVLEALNSCEEILSLMQDKDHYLFRFKAFSAPYVAAFAMIYGTVGQYAVSLRPDYEQPVKRDFMKARWLLRQYGNAAWAERLKMIQPVYETGCNYIMFHGYGSDAEWSESIRHNECNWHRRNSTKGPRFSHCFLPNEKESFGLRPYFTTAQVSAFSFKDQLSGKTFCGDYRCYGSIRNKFKIDLQRLFGNALKSLVLGSHSQESRTNQPSALNCRASYVLSPGGKDDTQKFYRDGRSDSSPLKRCQVPIQFNSVGAIKADGQGRFLCRGEMNGNLIPGWSDGKVCWFSYGGQGSKVSTCSDEARHKGFEIMANIWDSADDLYKDPLGSEGNVMENWEKLLGGTQWVDGSGLGGNITLNAIPAGYLGIEMDVANPGNYQNVEIPESNLNPEGIALSSGIPPGVTPVYVARCKNSKSFPGYLNARTGFTHYVTADGRHETCSGSQSQVLVCAQSV